MGQFGGQQTLIGADGKIVAKLVEDAEERKATGADLNDEELEAELEGVIVDELDEDGG